MPKFTAIYLGVLFACHVAALCYIAAEATNPNFKKGLNEFAQAAVR